MEWEETKSASCSEEGEMSRGCYFCDFIEIQIMPTTEHTYIATVTPPTCTEKGYTTYTCACGDSYVAGETAAIPHTMGEWKETKAPTCTAEGEKTRTCTGCDYTETETLPKTEHTYIATVTPPTCEEGGYTTYTCRCGDSYTDDPTAPAGHSYGEWIMTEPGVEAHTCSACGKTETRKAVPVYDIDGNGATEDADLTLLMSVLVGNTSAEELVTDLDFDGKLTVYDCVLLMQYLKTLA
ncbi:MAG: dockerin type I repeat-containing protein, partial [Clostridia bacterium]|nr:dockerin type I repeat-containing protein [Clostridia bacterium]